MIYCFGYSGKTHADIDKLLRAVPNVNGPGLLIDVRYSARSYRPEWRKEALQERFGGDYLHLKELGNVNYRIPGNVAILDYEAGRDRLLRLQHKGRDLFLMCTCCLPEGCHRTVVGRMLTRDGLTVIELDSRKDAILAFDMGRSEG